MHPRLAPLVQDIERQRTALLAAVEGQSAYLLNARPADPNAWSPAQILDHLGVVESGVARLLSHRLMRAKEAGLDRETATTPAQSPQEQAFLTQKIDAPENVRPADDAEAITALERLKISHAGLQAFFADADGYALDRVMARHQVFGEINTYEWLIFLARHEQRHVAQLVRTIAALKQQ